MSKLFRSLSICSLVTVLSRLTGLARELSLAYFFGASAQLDLFWIAYRIPNFLRRLFAEGALSQAMISVLAEYRVQNNLAQLKQFLNQLSSWLVLISSLITLLAYFAAPQLIWLFAPGIASCADKRVIAVQLMHIMFPTIIFISLASYSGGILNSYQHFGVPAFAQSWFNIIIVAIIWLFAPDSPQPIYLLAYGAFISGVIQWIFQWPSLAKLKLSYHFTWPHRHLGALKVLKLMVPALFGVSVAQINLMVDTFLLSFLPAGSVSWLNYADRLTSLPLGVVGAALATVVLPRLSQQHYKCNLAAFAQTLDWALRIVAITTIPCTLILQLLAEPIVSVLFQRGAFSYYDVQMSAKALRCLALGIPAFMTIKVLAACFYAQQNLRAPVKAAALAVLLNVILAVWFSRYWQHTGIAMAAAASSYLNAGLLWFKLTKTTSYLKPAETLATTGQNTTPRQFLKQLIMASFTIIVIITLANGLIGDWQQLDSLWRGISLTGILIGVAIGYSATLLAVRMPLKQLFSV